MIFSLTLTGVGAGALLLLLKALGWIDMSTTGIVLTSVVVSVGLHGAWACVISYVVGTEFEREE